MTKIPNPGPPPGRSRPTPPPNPPPLIDTVSNLTGQSLTPILSRDESTKWVYGPSHGDIDNCPFCGSKHTRVSTVDCNDIFVQCENCQTWGPKAKTIYAAKEKWGTRVKRELSHIEKHKALHSSLDELLADYLWHNPGTLLSSLTAHSLIEWSYQQTICPDENMDLTELPRLPLLDGSVTALDGSVTEWDEDNGDWF